MLNVRGAMGKDDLRSMPIDALWKLHEEVSATLAARIAAEKAKLEERLSRIEAITRSVTSRNPPRRPYPKVLPKYQNPKNLAETWSGRGKHPRWMQAQLKAGKKVEHFLIARSSRQGHLRAV